MKLYWKVMEAPTGRYRSFERRGWPMAFLDKAEGRVAFRITSEDDYVPAKVKTGKHTPLKLHAAVYHTQKERDELGMGTFTWRTFKNSFLTLADAKAAAAKFANEHPEVFDIDNLKMKD